MPVHCVCMDREELEARAQLIAENIQRTAQGEPPVNLIPALAE